MLRRVKLVREGNAITFVGWDEHGQLVKISAFEIRTTGDVLWLAKELAGSTPKEADIFLPPGLRLPPHAHTVESKFRCIIERLFAQELRPSRAAQEVDAEPGPSLRRAAAAEV